jgi:hypothetical protein
MPTAVIHSLLYLCVPESPSLGAFASGYGSDKWNNNLFPIFRRLNAKTRPRNGPIQVPYFQT